MRSAEEPELRSCKLLPLFSMRIPPFFSEPTGIFFAGILNDAMSISFSDEVRFTFCFCLSLSLCFCRRYRLDWVKWNFSRSWVRAQCIELPSRRLRNAKVFTYGNAAVRNIPRHDSQPQSKTRDFYKLIIKITRNTRKSFRSKYFFASVNCRFEFMKSFHIIF